MRFSAGLLGVVAAPVLLAAGMPGMEMKGEFEGAPGTCPGLLHGTPLANRADAPSVGAYNKALAELDIEAVLQDINELMTSSQDCWPADVDPKSTVGQSYGGLFIRLAWHCAGTFRATDGEGGCGGGRQRFQPESSWDDNTNLDKARALLWPIKEKYGDGLSWGDLFVFAGTGAIHYLGGPVTELCAGRIDDEDGTKSLPLGPGPGQVGECPIQGDCQAPLGAAVVGLIYVNPEGYLGVPNPLHSAVQIRDVFGRMGMNDSETVALIGGGHAFGKAHGACPAGPGPSPAEDPRNPWPGNCGTGRGVDTTTSGIEGKWTTDSFAWDNEYFTLLRDYGDRYTLQRGPGGRYQWAHPDPARTDLMMLTTDIAFLHDATYKRIVERYAGDLAALERSFAAAWEKLTVRGARWARNKRCWRPAPAYRLVSTAQDRSGAVDLEGAVLSGTAFVSLATADGAVRRVDFFLDGAAARREGRAPFDFRGGKPLRANAWNTRRVPAGRHVIRAVVTRGDGSTVAVEASFTVAHPSH